MVALTHPGPDPAPSAAVGPTGRTFAPIVGIDSWLRCGHVGTTIDLDDEVVTLTWAADVPEPDPSAPAVPGSAGLAFGPDGCLYHGAPEIGQVQRVPWGTASRAEGSAPAVVDLLAPPPDLGAGGGGFAPADGVIDPTLVVRAVALATDLDEHLFVLDGASGSIVVLDLADGHLVRTLTLASGRPVDLASSGREVFIAVEDRSQPLQVLSALGLPRVVPISSVAQDALESLPLDAVPRRVAAGPGGELWVLMGNATLAWAVPIDDARRSEPIEVPGATDLDLDGDARLVVAGPAASGTPPRSLFRRVVLTDTADAEDNPLVARNYDGRGICRTPDGRIGYWNGSAFRIAMVARRQFATSGHVDGYRLDSGTYQQQWGRVFIEACVPRGTSIEVGFVTSDEDPDILEPEGPSIARGLPQIIVDGDLDQALPTVLPPLVATGLESVVARTRPLHRRETGSELTWARSDPDDRFEVYEAPVQAPPGRYLWLRLALSGTGSTSPTIRAVRVEFPSHDLLRRLPRTYSRDESAASFLRRYLALTDGLLSDMELRAARRDLVLDPYGAPPEMLPWLASLIGLTLDGRWSEAARRQLLAEAICLFRRRGTIWALGRLLWIYLGCEVVIIEAFRFRGAGGAFVGGATGDLAAGTAPEPNGGGSSNAVVGFGFRVGGEVGRSDVFGETVTDMAAVDDAFETHAHRFSVIVPRDLSEEQLAVVHDLLDLHRPAHTLVDVCAAGRGMRVGIGLHVELSTVVGPSAGFHRSVVGDSRVGSDTVLGKPRAGVRPGGSHIGVDTVVDP